MPTVHEFSKSLGGYATLTDLKEAVEEALRDFNPDSRVSFRERGKDLTLVARWEIRPCDFWEAGCPNDVTHIGEDGAAEFCDAHSEANWPDYDEDAEHGVMCSTDGCEKASIFKSDGVNVCNDHALRDLDGEEA